MRYKYTGWQEVHTLAWRLGALIEPVFRPDAIVAIARGGLVVGRLMADYFLLDDLFVVKVAFWGADAKPSKEARITAPLSISLTGKKVLVVDEVADIGASLSVTRKHVYAKGASLVKTAVLQCFLPNAKTAPDFCVEEYDKLVWATFPWSITEDLKRIASEDPQLEMLYRDQPLPLVQRYLLDQYDLSLPEDIIEQALNRVYRIFTV